MAFYDSDYQAQRQKEVEEFKLQQQLKIKKVMKAVISSVL